MFSHMAVIMFIRIKMYLDLGFFAKNRKKIKIPIKVGYHCYRLNSIPLNPLKHLQEKKNSQKLPFDNFAMT